MISTISPNSQIITFSVGHEVLVRDSQKSRDVEALQVKTEKNTQRKEPPTLQESQRVESSPERVKEVVTRLQETLQHVAPRIELSVDKELNQVIVRILDKESGELIRQIPSEEVLELDRFFADLSGLFVEKEM